MEADLESGVISKRGLRIVRGEGCHIWDSEGNRYLDMGASYGVCNAGHCPRSVVEAIRSQSERMIYVSSSYDNPQRTELMKKLMEVSPFENGRMFLCNSGSEAVEAALKFSLDLTGRKRIIAARGSFHGRTMGALSLTFNPKYRMGFEEFLGPVDFVKYGDIDDHKPSYFCHAKIETSVHQDIREYLAWALVETHIDLREHPLVQFVHLVYYEEAQNGL